MATPIQPAGLRDTSFESAQDTTLRRDAAPMVPQSSAQGNGDVPFNTRVVTPYKASADSATIDVYTGVMNYDTLTKLRERAVYDLNALSYAPLADTGTGVLFPGAVQAKTEVETALRVRPTTFKGPQQLDVAGDDGEKYYNRQFHPSGTNISETTWYKDKGDDTPFVGFPNPNLFYMYTDAIPTHNVQNLSHAQMTDLMRTTQGDYDHMNYLDSLGSLLKSTALAGPVSASNDVVIETDGGGINGDPRLLEQMTNEYELGFQKARRIGVADASNDPRFGESAPGMNYTAEQQAFAESQETQFSNITRFTGMGSSYTEPVKLHT